MKLVKIKDNPLIYINPHNLLTLVDQGGATEVAMNSDDIILSDVPIQQLKVMIEESLNS